MSDEQPRYPISNYVQNGIAAFGLICLLVCGWMYWKDAHPHVETFLENFTFESGVRCYVIGHPQIGHPKIVFFCGKKGNFDQIISRGTSYPFPGGGSGQHRTGSIVIFEHEAKGQWTKLIFNGGKCTAKINNKGTRLILENGKEYGLKNVSPLWFQCNDDGTITELEELPDGFIEFFESSETPPNYKDAITTYPSAFQKNKE